MEETEENLIDKAEKAAKRIEDANKATEELQKKTEELLKKQQEMMVRAALGGKSNAGYVAPKEKTKDEEIQEEADVYIRSIKPK